MSVAFCLLSYARPAYLRQTAEAAIEHLSSEIDSFHIYVDGYSANTERNKRYDKLVTRYRKEGIRAEIGRRNRGVEAGKNVLLRAALTTDADFIIVSEDDIPVDSPKAVSGYVAACESSGLHALMFHAHGPGNKEPLAIGKGVMLWPDYVGAYTIYTRECLEACGLFDENFHGALGDVEMAVRLGEMGYTAPWKCAADATDSELWMHEIADSIEQSTTPVGSVKTQRAWAAGVAYWRQKDPALAARVFDERGNVRQNVPMPQGMAEPPPIAPRLANRALAGPATPTCEPATIDQIVHHYHAYMAPGWERIVAEHCEALLKSEMLGGRLHDIRLGVVGPDPDAVVDLCRQYVPTELVVHAETGFEQVTLTRIWENGQVDALGDAVLYAHVKGVTEPADYWRGEMTEHLVTNWEACLKGLETHEVVGCHWMRSGDYPWPFFGGNFFWARASVIKRLPKPESNNRWEAEVWLGQADPVALDMNPGHPRR